MDDLISRQAAIDIVRRYDKSHMILKGKPMIGAASIVIELEDLPSAQPDVLACGEGELSAQPEVTCCKDCKYWKDSDGVYRRGFDAESKCPLNLKKVYEGTFYCGMAESEDKE